MEPGNRVEAGVASMQIVKLDLVGVVSQVSNGVAGKNWWRVAEVLEGEFVIEILQSLEVVVSKLCSMAVPLGATAVVRPRVQPSGVELKPVFELDVGERRLLLMFDPERGDVLEIGGLSSDE